MRIDISRVRIKPLQKFHPRGAFCCNITKIQNYFRNNARTQNDNYQVRVFVACEGESPTVLGFYYLCLTSYKLGLVDKVADEKFGRVQAVPAVYLGMIAVHDNCAKQGIGKLLMADAILRTLEIADNAGTYALTLDALNDSLVDYYRDSFGFQTFKAGEKGLEMFLPLKTMQQSVHADSTLPESAL